MKSHRLVVVLALLGPSVGGSLAPAAPGRGPAVRPQPRLEAGLRLADGGTALLARPVTAAPPRSTRRAWQRFRDLEGGAWWGYFDGRTGVPGRVYGVGLTVPGSVASADVAERAARAVLARHVDLLAPGSRPDDFRLVTNHLDAAAGLRTVGYEQHHGGLRVLGGQVSFRFKRDRLFVIGSEAWPHVGPASHGGATVESAAARRSALAWGEGALARRGLEVRGPVVGPVILPIVRVAPGAGATAGAPAPPIEYRTVLDVGVAPRGRADAWSVFVDAASGTPVAASPRFRTTGGTVLFDAPLRYPQAERQAWPAVRAAFLLDGLVVETDEVGALTWATELAAAVVLRATGPFVNVTNAAGAPAEVAVALEPGASFTWDVRGDEFADAQLSAYVHAMGAKAWARRLAPEMPWLAAQLQVTVNIDDRCNAYSDGDSINFFRSASPCANTARLADVVHHEFGHSFHAHAILPGVGGWDPALGEGAADYVATTMSGDPKMGRGFYGDAWPLRQVDEPDLRWPEDVGGEDYYQTGTIFSGAMWDLRATLVAELGEEAGVARADELFFQVLQRATDVPSTYVEILAADDDDGDLANGTPSFCAIFDAFARHGLAVAVGGPEMVSRPTLDGRRVTIAGAVDPCPGWTIERARLAWRHRADTAVRGAVDLAPAGGASTWAAELPVAPAGEVVQYQVSVVMANGDEVTYPDNPADPWYEAFVGDVTPLYCTDLEGDAAPEGWSHEPLEGSDDWQWGATEADVIGVDPPRAYSGERVFGNVLGGRAVYAPRSSRWLTSPVVLTQGLPHVRLQYRRWLNVEDGAFDRATVYGDDTPLWNNRSSASWGGLHHQDREWRFHDVDLGSAAHDGAVWVRFGLRSDEGLEMGGWNIDDLCVVGYDVPSACGNGTVEGAEGCDDGNRTAGDGCSASCVSELPVCGDGRVEGDEECDDGNTEDGDDCTSACTAAAVFGASGGGGCGCRAAGRDGAGSGALAAGVLVALAALLGPARPRRRSTAGTRARRASARRASARRASARRASARPR